MQQYPEGALYVVATPIGNLADITLRALHVLQLADTLACEDTRHTQALLRAYGIERPGAQLLALHQHNEAEAAQTVLARSAAVRRTRAGLSLPVFCQSKAPSAPAPCSAWRASRAAW